MSLPATFVEPLRPRRLSALGAILALVSLLGCRSSSESLRPPSVEASVDHFRGTVLSGPVAHDLDDLDAAGALGVRCVFLFLDELPEGGFDSLLDGVRLVVAPEQSAPIRPLYRLAAGGRVAAIEDLEAFHGALGDQGREVVGLPIILQGVLPVGATTSFRLESKVESRAEDGSEGVPGLELSIHRRGAGGERELDAALAVSGIVETLVEPAREGEVADETNTEKTARSSSFERETLALRVLDGGSTRAFAIACLPPFGDTEAGAVLAIVSLHPSPEEAENAGDASVLERSLQDLSDSSARSREAIAQVSEADRLRSRIDTALEVEAAGARARSTVLFLADVTAAPWARELVLAASTETLEKVCERFSKAWQERARVESPPSRGEVAWLIDTAFFGALVDPGEGGETPPLSAAIQPILARRAGQAGRDVSVFLDLVGRASSHESFDRLLEEENRIALRDSSPAARARSFEWLVERGVTIPDYDPLGNARARRDALAKLEERESSLTSGSPDAIPEGTETKIDPTKGSE